MSAGDEEARGDRLVMGAPGGSPRTVQGAVGFGLNLVVVPVVAVLEPAALPAAMIIIALPMTAGSAIREPSHTDLSGVVWTTLADCPASPGVPGS